MTISKKRTRRTYDASFKEDVIKMISGGRVVSEVAKALGVHACLLHRWHNASISNSHKTGTQPSAFHNTSFEEIERLKGELPGTEQERDILKKPWEFSAARCDLSVRFR